jgi:tetratricopeptide (TPR) repeat protein
MKFAWKSFLLTLSLVLPATVAVAESTVPVSTEASEETETIVISESTPAQEIPPTHTPETVEELEVSADDEGEIAAEEGITPEEQVRLEKLTQADQHYRSGQMAEAQRLYREAKQPFAQEVVAEAQAKPEAISDPEQLSPAGLVYWRQAQAGIQQRLETKVLVPLALLTQNQPEFIPGQVLYAQALRDYNRPEEASQVLERAVNLYPNEPELLKAQISSYGQAEKWLEASLTARRFALLHPDHPEAETFTALAETNMDRYQDELREDIQGNAIANIVTGALGA